jgi:hypothetical protein
MNPPSRAAQQDTTRHDADDFGNGYHGSLLG